MEADKSSDFTGDEKPQGFLIVGIGASAGGIQALKEFFEHVPADSGMAYVVILHLSPDHDSQLAEVLQTASLIPVLQVVGNTKIEPNHVYVVPPNQHLVITGEFIKPSINIHTEERRAPIDIFFRNLADTHGPRAVCVVLSGTGANGSMGLKRIKERGGVAYVQSPREAEFNEMPRNSIATELVDEVLPVSEIPGHIIAYRNSLGSVQIVEEPDQRPAEQQQVLREIFTQLRSRTGNDFSHYKRATLLRRIERRINIRSLPDLPSYAAFLHDHPEETHALLKDLLISVTNFFRDRRTFTALEMDVLPALFNGKKASDQVRIWVAGCATGEEAYSIAMLCEERVTGVLDAPKIQIFATDIDETAIAAAREGFYTLSDVADVAPDRLRRFFSEDGDGYRVRREIREMIIFATHNFLKDPPFSRLDLVSCRNVLIYLNSTAQERVAETFHFALRPGGFLFLGTSETVDGASDLYSVFNREQHIYQARQISMRNYPIPDSVPSFHFTKNDSLQKENEKETRQRISFGDLHQKLLEQYAPPSVVVNEDYEIVHMSDKAGKYLAFSGGAPSQNLLKLVRPEIRLELRSALYQAVQNKTAVEAHNVKLATDGQVQSLDLQVRPVFTDGDTAKGFILVLFKPNEEEQPGEDTVVVSADEPVAKRLEEELILLKDQVRRSAEQYEFQAEELKASNEELQAMNEELRSAAEELETSKEELQSINEELRTVNQELKVKIDETSITSNNLQNLINSASVGTIFLDRSFSIRLFTPAVLDLFNLKAGDFGRPITDITHKLRYDGLLADAETVLEKLQPVEREVNTADGRVYLMRVLPYRTAEDRINGVVITFFDITNRKKSETARQQSEEHLRLIIESAKDYAIFTLDADRKVISWSSGAQLLFGYAESEIIGQSGDVFFVPEDREKKVPEEETQTAEKSGRAESERWLLRKDGSRFWGSGTTHPLHGEGGKLLGFVKIKRDLTKTRLLEEAKFFLAAIVETSNDSIITIDFQRNITSWNKAAEHLYGYSAKEAIGKNLTMLTLPEDFVEVLNKVDAVEHSREVVVFDTVRHKKGGELIDLEIVMSPVLNNFGEVIGISTIARDVSERKRREANLAFLAKINLDFAPLLTVPEVMEPLGKQLATYLHLSRCHFSIVEEEHDRIEVIYEYRQDEGLPSIKGVHRISDTFTEEGRRHFGAGNLAVINAPADSPLVKTPALMLKQIGFGSLVYLPHLEGGRWKFLLTIGRAEAGEWREDELELLQELAAKIYIRIERARAEEALRKSEAKFRRLSDSGVVAVSFFTTGGSIIEANDAFLNLLGVSRDDLQTEKVRWDAYTPKEWMPRTRKAIEEFEKTGYITPYEKQFYHSSGELRWGLFAGAALEDGHTGVSLIVDITERKRAEEALRQREAQLSAIFKALPVGIGFINTDGQMILSNEEMRRYLPNQIIPSQDDNRYQYWLALQPDGSFADRQNFPGARALRGEYMVPGMEMLFKPENGGEIWTRVSAVPVKGADGKTVGAVSVVTDITGLKLSEEALREREVRLRTLADVIPQVIWTNDAEGKANYFNQRWYEYTGLTYKQSAGPGWQAIVHPDDAAAAVEKWKKALVAGEVFDTEYRLRRHDGSYRWFIGRNVPLRDDSGKITGWFGSATDIENLKKTEEALSQSEARLRITMESATDYAIITMDTERRVERWSQGAIQLLGYTEEEMIGQSADIIFTEEDRKAGAPQQEMETARDTGRAADDRWHRRKNGSRFYANGVLRPIQKSGLTGYVKVMRDMTQQQLFTEELHRLVAERTLELQRSNDDLRQFASIASHDLQEPLRKLRLFASALQKFQKELPAEGQELLSKVYKTSDRMSLLIREVLQFSKTAYGAREFVPTDLHQILVTVLNDLDILLSETGATVTYDSQLPKIEAAPWQMNQLFYNLLVNAVKFHKQGVKPAISIQTSPLSMDEVKTYPNLQPDKDHIEIIVSDNGIGFDPQFSEQIFQIFERLHSVDEFEGTGVGLALCKKIAENHRGHIYAVSREGEGASFHVILPVKQ